MTMQQYCLRWNNHQPNFISVFSSLLNNESLVDVTLAAEGRHLQAHKVVLSACSSYFQSLFTINPCQHPIVILKDVKFADLKVMVDFMYYGEVNVSQEQLPHILKTAEMLKIKGLAEIPVDQSVSKSQNHTDRAELLTPVADNWSAENNPPLAARHSSLSSPSPLSPTTKRKRLRKSSTGSGSGSTERTSDEQQSSGGVGGGEMTLSANIIGGSASASAVIKSDPGAMCYTSSDNNSSLLLQKTKHHGGSSSDSDLQRGSSHESVEAEMSSSHQVTLQVPQDMNIHPHNLESSSIEVAGPSASTSSTSSQQLPISERATTTTTHAQFSQKNQQVVMGTKRGRVLMRQPRIKRESDPSSSGAAIGDDNNSELQQQQPSLSPQYQQHHHHHLSVPSIRQVERQCSEPLPALSPPPGNLLTVPGAILMKQHSHPLLPSQTHSPLSPPLRIQSISPSSCSTQQQQQYNVESTERAISPVVVISDPLSLPSSHEHSSSSSLKATDSATSMVPSTTTLRVRTDELKRSASSPQSGTRSSHCPVVRPGPALGCNYCWNTVDTHGRILRRKTKYHCPECQTNLCIVPCFQEYHERHVATATDPLALTTSVMRVFPKTTSM